MENFHSLVGKLFIIQSRLFVSEKGELNFHEILPGEYFLLINFSKKLKMNNSGFYFQFDILNKNKLMEFKLSYAENLFYHAKEVE